jgi:peptide/nickel transport system substrate-binding protein
MAKWALPLGVAVLAAMLAVPGAGLGAPAAVLPEITVIQAEDTNTLDAQMDWTVISRNIYMNVFGYLTFQDERMRQIPDHAERWERTDDRTMRFHLRRGVRFHNGEPVNAAAVKFSLDRILNPASRSPWIAAINFVESVNVVDEFTVDVRSQFPYPILVHEVGRMPLIPPRYFQEVGPARFAQQPVGSGPFMFREWVRGERMVFERYPNYWRGQANIQRLIYKTVPEAFTRVAELLAGRADLVVKVPPDLVEQVNRSGRARIVDVQSIQNVQIQFNHFWAPLSDRRVRQAIAHAIDVDGLIKHVLKGRARRTHGVFSPLVFGAKTNMRGYPYSPDQARELLQRANLPAGTVIPLNYGVGRIPQDSEIVQAIAGDLAKVGLRVEVRPQEWGAFFAARQRGNMPGMQILTSTATLGDPDQILKFNDSRRQPLYYHHPALDDVIEQQRIRLDPKERLPHILKLQDMIMADVGWLALFDLDLLYGVSNRLDWQPRANELIWLWPAKAR